MIITLPNITELNWQERNALEDMSTQIQAGWGIQHQSDGSHSAITATSVGAHAGDVLDITSGFRMGKGPWLIDADGDPTYPAAAIHPPQITANQNDYAPNFLDQAIFLDINSDAARSITGITTARRRRMLYVVNTGSFTITLKHETTSTAVYRFSFPNSKDYQLLAGEQVLLHYNPTSQRWRGPATVNYIEASWTPTDASGAGLALTLGSSTYVKLGQLVFASFDITYPATASGATALIGGLPVTSNSARSGAGIIGFTNYSATDLLAYAAVNNTKFNFYDTGGATLTNTQMSTRTVIGTMVYRSTD